jgi:SAM-dependent methyltransferase
VTDTWSARAQLMRESPTHRSGADLDLVVAWCEPGAGVRALDVATGGGHVARRLREEGCDVVSLDPAPGMEPDVIGRAEELPFDDGSFDIVACRIAAHHFEDVRQAIREMARVTRSRVVVQDNLFVSQRVEEADRTRDPSHVRCYTEDEWVELFESAGLVVEAVALVRRKLPLEPWIERAIAGPEVAERVRELMADLVDGEGNVRSTAIVVKGRKRG